MDVFLVVLFLVSYFYMLNQIDLRMFTILDIYLFLFPVYIVLFVQEKRNCLWRILLPVTNILSFFAWLYIYLI
jgi:hypothetical protein